MKWNLVECESSGTETINSGSILDRFSVESNQRLYKLVLKALPSAPYGPAADWVPLMQQISVEKQTTKMKIMEKHLDLSFTERTTYFQGRSFFGLHLNLRKNATNFGEYFL